MNRSVKRRFQIFWYADKLERRAHKNLSCQRSWGRGWDSANQTWETLVVCWLLKTHPTPLEPTREVRINTLYYVQKQVGNLVGKQDICSCSCYYTYAQILRINIQGMLQVFILQTLKWNRWSTVVFYPLLANINNWFSMASINSPTDTSTLE